MIPFFQRQFRNAFFISFLLILSVSYTRAQGEFVYIRKSEQPAFDSLLSITKEGSVFVYLNFNDCFNCNLIFNSINRSGELKEKKVICALDNVPASKANIFLSENNITPSILVTERSGLLTTLGRIALENNHLGQSYFLKYYGNGIAERISFKKATDHAALNKFINDTLPVTSQSYVKNDSAFYTSFSKVICKDNRIIVLTLPKSTIHIFDTSGLYLNSFSLSQKEIVSFALPRALSHFNEFIQNDTANAPENIINRFNGEIQSVMGKMEMMRIYNLLFQNDTFYIVGSITIPVSDVKRDAVDMFPIHYLIKADKNLNVVSKTDVDISLSKHGLSLVDHYGLIMNKEGNDFLAPIYNYRKVNTSYTYSDYFLARWTLNKITNQFDFNKRDSSIHFNNPFSANASVKLEEIVCKFDRKESILAFEYLPVLIDIKTNKNILIREEMDTALYYKNELFDKIRYNGKEHLIMVERIAGVSYVSLLDGNFKRIASKPLPRPEARYSTMPAYFISNNQLKFLCMDRKGTSISTIDIRSLF